MNFKEKLKVTTDKVYISSQYKKHNDNYYCNKWWCYKGKLITVALSDLKPNVKDVPFKPHHRVIEYEILEKGFNYNMGYITVNGDNRIIDGHHRYFILKKHFDDTTHITVLKLSEIKSIFPRFIIKMSVIYLFVKIYSLLTGKKKTVREIELDIPENL